MVSSSSSSSGKISFSGLASGIDTASIISQLMAVQKRPVYAIMDRVDGIKTKIDAYTAIKSAMSSLLTSAAPLKDASTFGQRSTVVGAVTADVGKVSATATNGAAIQNFTFEAVSLATATTAVSATAMGSPIDSAVKLDDAGFGDTVTAGTYGLRRPNERRHAVLQHRRAWAERERGDTVAELKYLDAARQSYQTAFEKDSAISDESAARAAYLIGDLWLRLGEPMEAARWLETAVRVPEAKSQTGLIRMARERLYDARELLTGQKKAS